VAENHPLFLSPAYHGARPRRLRRGRRDHKVGQGWHDASGHLPSPVTALTPAVSAVQGESGDLLANATRRNVTLNVEKLKAAARILNAAVDGKKIRVGGGVYKLATGHVELVA
jgi:carbonic anhydrase